MYFQTYLNRSGNKDLEAKQCMYRRDYKVFYRFSGSYYIISKFYVVVKISSSFCVNQL